MKKYISLTILLAGFMTTANATTEQDDLQFAFGENQKYQEAIMLDSDEMKSTEGQGFAAVFLQLVYDTYRNRQNASLNGSFVSWATAVPR